MRYSRFTLVELLAAMAILVLVGSASAAALYSFHRNHLKVSKLSDRLERNRKIDKVAELMGNMIPFEWQSDNEDGRTLVFEGAPDELFFTAMRLPDNQGRGAIIFVRLYVDEEKRLMCDYSNTPMLPWDEDSDNPAGMKSTVIAENVEALTMRYGRYDDDDQIEWLDVWDQDDEEYKNQMPAAVGFTIEFADGEKLSYLRRTAGLSAFSGLAQ